MRLQCDVEVVNRALPSLGLRGHSRSRRAVLSIGKHADRSAPSSGLYLLICTARDRSGSKYKLKENIEKFFTWFVEEGKATVRLKEPAIDICLSKVKTYTNVFHEGLCLILCVCVCHTGGHQQLEELPLRRSAGTQRK
uniref:PIF1/LRR1 pleckstrin homology domain-containing protein n=1 Tax=Cyprinus carpio TaxID=7962 RepID=A0A8C2JV71_CYPCA